MCFRPLPVFALCASNPKAKVSDSEGSCREWHDYTGVYQYAFTTKADAKQTRKVSERQLCKKEWYVLLKRAVRVMTY